MAITHSDKALKTLHRMGTQAPDWGLVEFEWVERILRMPVKEDCPSCRGRRRTSIVATDGGRLLTQREHDLYYGNRTYHFVPAEFRSKSQHQIGEMLGIKYGDCPTCRGPRGRSTGKITIVKDVKVRIGIPQWAAGTKFDSRFSRDALRQETATGKAVRDVCELCSKSITSEHAGTVPVTGRGADGIIHGMWVGRDCARKFFGFKNFKKDQVVRRDL